MALRQLRFGGRKVILIVVIGAILLSVIVAAFVAFEMKIGGPLRRATAQAEQEFLTSRFPIDLRKDRNTFMAAGITRGMTPGEIRAHLAQKKFAENVFDGPSSESGMRASVYRRDYGPADRPGGSSTVLVTEWIWVFFANGRAVRVHSSVHARSEQFRWYESFDLPAP